MPESIDNEKKNPHSEHNGFEEYDGNMGLGLQRSAYNNISYKKIGNEEQIEELMGNFDDEEMKKAIEESLKISDEYNKDKEKEKEEAEKKGKKKVHPDLEEKKINK